jgi:GAF domain-containing protein
MATMDKDLPLADELAAVFARMSGLLLSTETVNTALELITALAKEAIPGTDGSGVTLLDGHGRRVTAAATDMLVSDADSLQYEFDEGPCLTAWEQRSPVRVDDLTSEERWPRWVAAAVATGVRAVLSAPMVAGDEALGALKVYSHQPGAYADREHLLAMFAAHAAVLLASVRSYEDARRVSDELRDSMRTRDLVNVAKGVLMARDAVDERTAFLFLSRTAREQGTPLHEVARSVADTTTRRRR